uniref:acid phosphatase n=1 Tax=Trichuris muris TaxID=70415 RepID=A0A5S6QG81_TRIMR
MEASLWWLLFYLLFISVQSLNGKLQSDELGDLVFLHLVWRHGDRAPVHNFTTNPDKASEWPEGLGELTKVGIQEHYKLGKHLRNRYSDFLPAVYNAKIIHVRSTDYNRTIMSALANLAGLFPLKSGDHWSANLSWQPVPVHSVPGAVDNVLNMDSPCPRSDALQQTAFQSKEVAEVVKDYEDVFGFLRNETGLPLTSLKDIRFVYDPLNCARIHGHALPYWATEQRLQNITDLFKLSTTYWFKSAEHKRLRGGLLLKDILLRMLSVSRNRTDSAFKLYAYSAHDATLVALLENLGIYEGQMFPTYASVIIFELRKVSTHYFVRVLYRIGANAEETVLKLPFCAENCPLDVFAEQFDSSAPTDWKVECGLEGKRFAWKTYALVFFVITIIVVLLLMAETVYFVNKQRRCLYAPLEEEQC